jgi:hypothetical protein
MVGAYVAFFAALALVALGCGKWPVFAELWYCYKYEKTQDSVWRQKLAKLGEAHPEQPVSRWFYLMSYIHKWPEVAELPPLRGIECLPLTARQKALGLWLRERLKGDWAAEPCVVPTLWSFPLMNSPKDWLPQVEILRDAMRRVRKPPSSTGVAICWFGDVCQALALCGDETGLPYLEDNLFNDAGLYPYREDAITDCMQGPPGVVTLAAYGNERAREDVLKGLRRLRRRTEVAYCIEETLKAGGDYRPENLAWLRATLADYRKQRAAEEAAAEERYRELAADIERLSCAGYWLEPCRSGLTAGRVTCREGSPAVEEVRISLSGGWWLRRAEVSRGDCLGLWKELLAQDLFSLPEEITLAEWNDDTSAAYRIGERYRTVWRGGILATGCRLPDEPATWVGAFVAEQLKTGAAGTTGQMASPVKSMELLREAWFRGEPWEEVVRKFPAPATSAMSSPVDE